MTAVARTRVESGMDGGIEALAAVEGVTAGETGGNLAGGGPEEDVVEVSNGLRWAQAAEGGEAEGVVGAVPGGAASVVLGAFLAVALGKDSGGVGG